MSIPKKVFIDTSVFRQHGYNFETSSFSALRDYCKRSDASLLLPDPIEREIRRHIKQSCADALNSLDALQKKAPFLKKLKSWPYSKTDKYALSREMERTAYAELEHFLRDVKAEQLGYDNVTLTAIMDRYDRCEPPFGPQKRKEFPDALAVEILSQYSALDDAIAVITNDGDIQSACAHLPHLHTFRSIAEFLEASNVAGATLVQLQEALQQEIPELNEALIESFRNSSFSIEEEWEGEVENVEVEDLEYSEMRVVSVGQHDCTLIFDATVSYRADVSYTDYTDASYDKEDGIYFNADHVNCRIRGSADLSGICKLSFGDSPLKIQSLKDVDVDQSEFWVSVEDRDDEY